MELWRLAPLTGLLFAEEAGVPLPFAPGELTLLVAGLLIASGDSTRMPSSLWHWWLVSPGVVVVEDEPEMRFDIRPDLRPALEQLLAAMHPTLTAVSAAPSSNAQLSEVRVDPWRI